MNRSICAVIRTLNTFGLSLFMSFSLLSSANGQSYGDLKVTDVEHEFYFTRGIYGEELDADWGPRWAVDYPKADLQFLVALKRLTIVDGYPSDNAIHIGDPDLREFPFLYVLEVGALSMSEDDVVALRDYLDSGGFLVIDDFWGRLRGTTSNSK